jgi:mannose-6-phosphate isomerase-like protein (cupin superfamily)
MRKFSGTGYVGFIEGDTEENENYRQVLFTGDHLQLVLMSLKPGEEIGDEVHEDTDQFFRIEQGKAKFVFNESEEHLVEEGDAVVIPAGTYHNVLNNSPTEPLKLYTVYTDPQHPDGAVYKTKAEAETEEKGNNAGSSATKNEKEGGLFDDDL